MIRKYNLFLFLIIIGFFGCHLIEKEQTDDLLARVNDVYLSKNDIGDLLNKLDGAKDSATIMSNYINNWVQQELLLQKAELNLREDQKDFQKLLENYRKSLIIYAYQQEWIRQTLNTEVLKEEIADYYHDNKLNFELKENIIKSRYVVVPKNAPKLEQLEKDLRTNDVDGRKAFHEYCVQYAYDYNDNDSVWKAFNEVMKNIPLEINNSSYFLSNSQFVSTTDSLYIYMLKIEAYKLKDHTSPLEYESEKIKNIIINQRKMSLLNEMKKNLFNTSLQKGKAEIYQH